MEALRIEDRGYARWLTLNRPERRNALSRELMRSLQGAIAIASELERIRCLVLTGAGPTFCAGADLAELQETDDPAIVTADGELIAHLLETIATSPKPVIARVEGSAFGGGVGLLAAADYVVASREARFALSEVRLGLIPAVISPFVLRAIGRRHALPLMLSGMPIDADEAARIGLIHRAVEIHELDAAVDELIGALGSAAPSAVGAVKHLLSEIEGWSPEDVRDRTVTTFANRRLSDEGQEGLRAFLEKRDPRWKSDH